MAQLNREHGLSLQDINSQSSLMEGVSYSTNDSSSRRETRQRDGDYSRRLRELREREAHRMHRESAEREGQYSRITRQLRELMRRLAANEEAMRDLASQERNYRSRLNASLNRNEWGFRTGSARYSFGDPAPMALARRAMLEQRVRDLDRSSNADSAMQTDSDRPVSRGPTPEGYGRPRRSVLRENSTRNRSNAESNITMKLLEDTIAYLANLRNAATVEECAMFASLAGFTYKDIEDKAFVLNLDNISPPAPTSLLNPGATFSGEQFANNNPPDYTHPSSSTSASSYNLNSLSILGSHDQLASDFSSLAPTRGPPASYRRWTGPWESESSRNLSSSNTDNAAGPFGPCPFANTANSSSANATSSSSGERWPVTVRIFSVDYKNMTLSASMEAYDVPSHPSTQAGCNPASHSLKAITTYLEGEIVDLHTHSLLTENFTATLELDAIYWHKLPPFSSVPAADLPAKLLNRDFLRQCNEKYVLMRWKEKCFVHDSANGHTPLEINGGDFVVESDGCGLTISGFYYVSMRREDGLVEGLYCDPQSSPYQYLRLGRVPTSAFPAWDFR